MIPLALDPAAVPLAVAGRDEPALRRFRALRAGGAEGALLFCDAPDAALRAEAGDALRPHLPDADDLQALRLLWVAGLPDDLAASLAAQARVARVLVNVEDRRPWCDFHNVAEVRRGDLLLTVSTNGRSPGLAARIRARLAQEFGPEWAKRTETIAAQRQNWRRQPRTLSELARLTDRAIDQAGWLQ